MGPSEWNVAHKLTSDGARADSQSVENTAEMIQEALDGVLARRPDGRVAAFDANAVRVALPSSLGLQGRPELPYRALVELIPNERAMIVAMWERARSTGSSVGSGRLVDGSLCQGYLFDVRDRHGVLVLVLDVLAGDLDGSAPGSLPPASPAAPPRLSRVRKNELSVILSVDEATVVGFGWAEEELVGRRTLELIHAEDQDRGITNWLEMLAAPGLTHRWKGRHLCRDGSHRWMEFVNTNLLETEGYVLTEMVDISDEMAAREALVASERLFKGLAEALPIGVAQVEPSGRLVFSNEQLARTLGTAAPTTITELGDVLVELDRGRFEDRWASLVTRGVGSVDEYELGDGRSVEIVARPLDAEDEDPSEGAPPGIDRASCVQGAVLCVSDISERVESRQDLERRARIDPLTQVLNRSAIEAHLAEVMAYDGAGSATHDGVAVVFIDIDGFKSVNDELGHSAGDQMLSEVGQRLRAAVRARGDQVGRMGGDEFLVVCGEVPDLHHARALRDRIDRGLHQSPALAGERPLRASLGVAWSDDPAVGPTELVRDADQDMYRVKRARVTV